MLSVVVNRFEWLFGRVKVDIATPFFFLIFCGERCGAGLLKLLDKWTTVAVGANCSDYNGRWAGPRP